MTDLQLSLLALGALIILTVVAFNWWQERRMRKEVVERFEQSGHDPLMDSFRIDTENVEDHEPLSARRSELDKEPFVPAMPQLPNDDNDYEHSVNEAVSAIAEFEKDMAVPIRVASEPVSDEVTFGSDEKTIPLEQATTQELLEEAGLDEHAESSSPEIKIEPSETQTSTPQITAEPVALPANISSQIDLVALLYLPQLATGNALCEFLLPLAEIDKPLYAYGLGLDGAWHMLTSEQGQVEFTRAACSLQLADRAGPISNESLSYFQQAVDKTGLALKAQVEWQTNNDPKHYAAELDQFCIEVDKMVGFHLAQGSSGPFTGTKFRGLAEASGLVLRDNGHFHCENESGQSLFAVVNQDNNLFTPEMLRSTVLRGIVFQLDIPRVKNCAEVFNQMVLVARQMENSMGGQLVDDNQRTIDEVQIEKIRQQLKMIHAKMLTRGIVPGSPIALRLFS